MAKVIMISKYVLISLFNFFILRLSGYLIVPIGVLFTKPEDKYMPKIFNWYNHQLGFITDPISNLPQEPPYNSKPYTSYDELFDKKVNGDLVSRWTRIRWLWRNPNDMFHHLYTDIIIKDPIIGIVEKDSGEVLLRCKFIDYGELIKIGERQGDISGKVKVSSGKYFEYYLIKPYKLFGLSLAFKVRFGWKMYDKRIGDSAEFVCDVNPFTKYDGSR